MSFLYFSHSFFWTVSHNCFNPRIHFNRIWRARKKIDRKRFVRSSMYYMLHSICTLLCIHNLFSFTFSFFFFLLFFSFCWSHFISPNVVTVSLDFRCLFFSICSNKITIRSLELKESVNKKKELVKKRFSWISMIWTTVQ